MLRPSHSFLRMRARVVEGRSRLPTSTPWPRRGGSWQTTSRAPRAPPRAPRCSRAPTITWWASEAWRSSCFPSSRERRFSAHEPSRGGLRRARSGRMLMAPARLGWREVRDARPRHQGQLVPVRFQLLRPLSRHGASPPGRANLDVTRRLPHGEIRRVVPDPASWPTAST
jgi:hypothetical protein